MMAAIVCYYTIAAIAGEGIGNEVVPEGIRVFDSAGKRFGFPTTGITYRAVEQNTSPMIDDD